MVWGATAYDTRSPLILIHSTMTGQRYLAKKRFVIERNTSSAQGLYMNSLPISARADKATECCQGRPTATSSADDRYLTLCALRNRTSTPTFLRSSLSAATGRLWSTSTARRRLHEGDLYARRPAIACRSRHRLQWARQHVHWTPDQWRAVLFTYESRFSLEGDSRRYLIWREPGTRYHPSNISERDAYGRGSVCVWGGISLAGHFQTSISSQGEP
ncbi:Transposable element Tcb2 transposase, partial [Stegodyphus mimosarum]